MTGRFPRNWALVSAIAFVITACTAATPTSAPNIATGAPTAAPTIAFSQQPVATPIVESPQVGSPAESAQTLSMGTLFAGRYRTTNFEPTLAFDLADGWQEYFPEDSDEIALGGPGADLNITRPTQVVNPDPGPALDAPETMIDWLTSNAKLQAGDAKDIEIDGIASKFVVVAPPSNDVGLFHYSGGDMHLPAGVPARFHIVPMDGADLVVVAYPPEGSHDFDAAVAAVEPIVESLAITP